MLTRDSISSGAYFNQFSQLPADLLWSPERIARSLHHTIVRRRQGAVWLFAYGSLIWNPLLRVSEKRRATLPGWHRSFCLRAVAGRGSIAAPGRMLSLEADGETSGVALLLDAATLDEELRILWSREMLTGAYVPTWARVQLEDGRETWAIVFVSNSDHPLYEPDARVSTVAPLIGAASGPLGSNADYVFLLDRALSELSLADPYVRQIAAQLATNSIKDSRASKR